MDKKKKVYFILLTLEYIVLQGLAKIVSNSDRELMLGNISLQVNNIAGCVSVFCIGACILLVMVDYRRGARLGYTLTTISSISIVIGIFKHNSLRAISGLLMNIGAMLIIYIIYLQMKKEAETKQMLENLAVTDSLTGLANRRQLMKAISGNIEDNINFSLIYLDVDDFKKINDSEGHKFGDKVLSILSSRWSDIADSDTLITRYGGDEFVIVLRRKSRKQIEDFVEKIREVSNEPFVMADSDTIHKITVSMGISKYPSHGNNAEQLIKNADIALHEAKKQGKNRCEYFSSALEMMFQKENDIEEYILSALENNRFYMTYQTQYTMDKKIRGIESLIRLCNDNGETVSPVDFIPVAEKSDLIIKIDDWVLEHVLDDTLELVSKTNNEITVSVNVSAKHIMNENYAKAVIAKLEKRGYPAKSLEIEITEYCLLGNLNNAIENLTILRNAGVQIAIDDFGTGYSSLGNISKLPIDLLKIDKVFIDNAAENQLDEDFINIIISIAHLINCKVICEGVEQEAQLDILRRHSCDYIQGFLWSRPMVIDEVVKEIVGER